MAAQAASGPGGRPERQPRGRTPGEPLAFGITEASARLGVSASTLRSWHRRYGLAPTARTPGGHRRYSMLDLSRLREVLALVAAGVPTADAAGSVRDQATRRGPSELDGTLGREAAPAGQDRVRDPLLAALPAGSRSARRLREAMASLNPRAVVELVRSELRRHGTVQTWQELLVPALIALGEHWALSGCDVASEHVTSSAIELALRRHALRLRPRDARALDATGGGVLLAAGSGEAHILPLVAVNAALAERGVESVVAGELPRQALGEAIGQLRPGVVVLWSRAAATASPGLLVTASDLVGQRGSVWAAGPGWNPRALPKQVGHLMSLPDAVAAASNGAGPTTRAALSASVSAER